MDTTPYVTTRLSFGGIWTSFAIGPTAGTATSVTSSALYTRTATWDVPMAVEVGIAANTQVFVTLRPECKNEIIAGKALQANPDISGLGVVLAFTISSYAVFLWSIFAYRFGLIPSTLLRTADRRVFYANSRRANTEWTLALERAAIMFSDQQIITGISIMLAAYAGLFVKPGSSRQSLSAYHWQTATYLAWMSSNVHLATLDFLRPWLKQNRVLLVGRLVGMTTLLLLLLTALIPTLSDTWILATTSPQYFGIAASCFWDYSGDLNFNAPLSLAFLVFSYVWKVGQLHDVSRHKFRKWFRSTPEWLLETLALRLLHTSRRPALWRRALFRVITMVYVPLVATCEFLESFAASLSLVCLGLAWGSLQIFGPKSRTPKNVRLQENSIWSFGQILPLLFLLQPAAALFEHFYGKGQTEYNRKTSAVESQELSALSIRQGAGSNEATPSFHKLSEVLLARGLRTPSAKSEDHTLEPQLEFLYSSRFFKVTMWLIQTSVLALALVVLLFEGRTSGRLGGPAGGYYLWEFALLQSGSALNVVAAFLYGIVGLFFIVSIGSFFSKGFR